MVSYSSGRLRILNFLCTCYDLALWQRRSSHERSCSTLSPVCTGMGDRLRAGIPHWYVTKPTKSVQPCISLGSLNRVPALTGWDKGGNVTSAGRQDTEFPHRGEVGSKLLYLVTSHCFTLLSASRVEWNWICGLQRIEVLEYADLTHLGTRCRASVFAPSCCSPPAQPRSFC